MFKFTVLEIPIASSCFLICVLSRPISGLVYCTYHVQLLGPIKKKNIISDSMSLGENY
jgi:hypothetical protein